MINQKESRLWDSFIDLGAMLEHSIGLFYSLMAAQLSSIFNPQIETGLSLRLSSFIYSKYQIAA